MSLTSCSLRANGSTSTDAGEPAAHAAFAGRTRRNVDSGAGDDGRRNLLYFYLLDHVGPTKTQSVAFLIPVFALLAGVLLLGESVSRGTLVGLGIIFAGVGLVIEVPMFVPRMVLPALLWLLSRRCQPARSC